MRSSEDPQDIMILCPISHHEATVEAMTEDEQRFYKLHPFNIERKYGQGKLKINQKLKLYDHNDQLLAHIEDNEWISGDPMPWDLESSFQWLKICHRLRNIALEIDARTSPIEIRADLWQKSQNFQLNPHRILFNGIVQNVGFINLCFVAIRLVADTPSKLFYLESDPRFGKVVIVSLPDLQERIKKGLKAWQQLKEES